jgi:hypothetical protein
MDSSPSPLTLKSLKPKVASSNGDVGKNSVILYTYVALNCAIPKILKDFDSLLIPNSNWISEDFNLPEGRRTFGAFC